MLNSFVARCIFLIIFIELLVKNCHGLKCYDCDSKKDADCYENVSNKTKFSDCTVEPSICTILFSKVATFGESVGRGCTTSCTPKNQIDDSGANIIICCTTDLCNSNVVLPTTTPTTTSTTKQTMTTTMTATTTDTTTTTTKSSNSGSRQFSIPSFAKLLVYLVFSLFFI